MTDLELVATERDKWIKTLSKPKQPFSEPVKPLADKWVPPLECGMKNPGDVGDGAVMASDSPIGSHHGDDIGFAERLLAAADRVRANK